MVDSTGPTEEDGTLGREMLNLYGITAFVPRETISQIESYFHAEPGQFATETVEMRDHRGESGTMTFVFVGRTQMGLAPSNDFHYPGDFEIGLTIQSGFTIADVEQVLTENGYEFERGYFANDEDQGYYLIPRKGDLFTPFFVVSDKDTSKNRALFGLQSISLQIDEEEAKTTENFMSVTGLSRNAGIEIRAGSGNRIISAAFALAGNPVPPGLFKFGDLELEVREIAWWFRQ